MNAEEIRKMEAGREMDAAVAIEMMGWKWDDHNPRQRLLCSLDGQIGAVIFDDGMADNAGVMQRLPPLPHYSTGIAAAWELVEKLRLAIGPALDTDGWWYATRLGTTTYGVDAPTAPLAICRAALLAVMGAE